MYIRKRGGGIKVRPGRFQEISDILATCKAVQSKHGQWSFS